MARVATATGLLRFVSRTAAVPRSMVAGIQTAAVVRSAAASLEKKRVGHDFMGRAARPWAFEGSRAMSLAAAAMVDVDGDRAALEITERCAQV